MSVDIITAPDARCLTTTESTPGKLTGFSAETTCLKGDQTCQGLMKILSAVTKAMLDLAKRYPKGIQISSFLCIQLLISHVSPFDLGKKQLLNENKLSFITLWPIKVLQLKSHTCTSDLDSVVKRMIRSSEVSKRNFKASCQRHFDAASLKVWKAMQRCKLWFFFSDAIQLLKNTN